jgi:Icc-related predicted phosphoesterase
MSQGYLAKNFTRVALALCAAGYIGCKEKPAEPPPPPPPPPKAEPVPPKPAPEPQSDPDCVGPVATGTAEAKKIGDQSWELNGSTLKLAAYGKKGTLTLGVVSDIKEDSPENLENLKAFAAWFKKEKADVIVVAGDTGLAEGQIEAALGVLAGVGVPVFNIVGNREGKALYKASMAKASAAHANIFDLNRIRRVDTPVVDLVSMPGYFNPAFIHAEDGCAYYPKDLTALGELVATCDSPVVLVSHGGPKQEGENGIDRSAEGEHVGDPGLAALLKDKNIPFGIFGNIHEAGGKATDVTGATVLPQDKPQKQLYLNPGPTDGVRWAMNDKTESVGMAALVTFNDKGEARYKIKRQAVK